MARQATNLDSKKKPTPKQETPTFKAALLYAGLGWRVVPIWGLDKKGNCLCGKADCSSPGKHPRGDLAPKGLHDASGNERVLRRWFSRGANNIGIVTGSTSGLWALDVDGQEGAESLAAMQQEHSPLPKTVLALTGGGGEHWLFALPEDGFKPPNTTGNVGRGLPYPKLDTRGEGGYIVVEPSRHRSGRDYNWEVDHHPEDTPLAPAPPWLVDMLHPRAKPTPRRPTVGELARRSGPADVSAYGQKALSEEMLAVQKAAEGTRNSQLNTSAFALGQLVGGGVLDRGIVEEKLTTAAILAGLSEAEARRTIKGGMEAGMLQPRKVPDSQISWCLDHNEVGDAALVVPEHRGKLVYDHAAGTWHQFTKHRWVEDTRGSYLCAVNTAVEAYEVELAHLTKQAREAAREGNSDKEKKTLARMKTLLKRVSACQGMKRCQNIMAFAAAGPGSLGITGEEWDSKPGLMACPNGVLELDPEARTVTFREGRSSDYLKKSLGVPWPGDYGVYEAAELDPLITCDKFNAFLDEVVGAEEVADYLWRLFGYALMGQVTEHVLPILWGRGRNGKGTLLEFLSFVMGDYAGPVKSELLLVQDRFQSAAAPNPELLGLRGKRLCWASETGEGRRMNAAKVKWLVGGDQIVARALYGKREVTFAPTHTLLLLTNHRPAADAVDYALWQRIHLVPFNLSYVDDPQLDFERKRNPHLLAELKAEAEGMLPWLVGGWLSYLKDGLNPPDEVLAATRQYRDDEDLIGHFIFEHCRVNPEKKVKAGYFMEKLEAWCKDNGLRPLSSQRVGRYMGEVYQVDRKAGKGTWYCGLEMVDFGAEEMQEVLEQENRGGRCNLLD